MEFYLIAVSSSQNNWGRRASESDVNDPGRQAAAAPGPEAGIGWGPFRDPSFVPTDPRVHVPCSYVINVPMNIFPNPPNTPRLCLIDAPSTLELDARPQSGSYGNITNVFEVTASTRMLPVYGVSLTASLSNTDQRRAVCEPGGVSESSIHVLLPVPPLGYGR